MKRTAAILLCAAMLAGCAGGAINTMNLTAKDLIEPRPGAQNTAAQTVARGANDFAFRLSAKLVENAGDGNFVCSPYSVWLPLAALVNATDAANRDALLSALSATGVSAQDVNDAASRMLYGLTNQGSDYPHDPLKIANAIFVSDAVTLRKDFAQTFLDYYRGSAMSVDFSSQAAVDAVNKWAKENTDGLITDVVQEFDPLTVAAIANAIYFSDRWLREFNPRETAEDVFHSPGGDSLAHFMLRMGDNQTYYEDDRVQAMPLSFSSGGLYILLPKDGDANALLSSMTNEYFEEIQNDSIRATGKLLLPRFSIQSGTMQLSDTLTALGVPLFDAQAAPLTGGLIEQNLPVWLSSAVQKAVINVDEKGTTAAAVTVVVAPAGVIMSVPTEPFEMKCDRPFVFVLYSHTYDGGSQVLFTGIVNQP